MSLFRSPAVTDGERVCAVCARVIPIRRDGTLLPHAKVEGKAASCPASSTTAHSGPRE
jgi:hypothetical protein